MSSTTLQEKLAQFEVLCQEITQLAISEGVDVSIDLPRPLDHVVIVADPVNFKEIDEDEDVDEDEEGPYRWSVVEFGHEPGAWLTSNYMC